MSRFSVLQCNHEHLLDNDDYAMSGALFTLGVSQINIIYYGSKLQRKDFFKALSDLGVIKVRSCLKISYYLVLNDVIIGIFVSEGGDNAEGTHFKV